MPDNNGIFSLVQSYLAQAGQTIKVSQHNPVLEDIADALNRRLMRDGTTPMNDDLPMGSNKITGLADGVGAQDAAAFGQIATAIAALGQLATLAGGADKLPYFDSNADAALADLSAFMRGLLAAADAGTARGTLGAVASADKASTPEAQAGVDDTKWMTPARTFDAAKTLELGAGQTYQNLDASRSVGTTYQNTTGRTIFIIASGDGTALRWFQVSENGSSWTNLVTYQGNTALCIPIRDGLYYRLESGITKWRWAEIR